MRSEAEHDARVVSIEDGAAWSLAKTTGENRTYSRDQCTAPTLIYAGKQRDHVLEPENVRHRAILNGVKPRQEVRRAAIPSARPSD